MSVTRNNSGLSQSVKSLSTGRKAANRRSRQIGLLAAAATAALAATDAHLARAADTPYYWDTATTSGLQSGAGTWDASTTAMWDASNVANTNPLLLWNNGNGAFFETGGTDSVTINGTVSAYEIRVGANDAGTGSEGSTTIANFVGTGIVQVGAGGIATQGGASGVNFSNSTSMQLTASQNWTPGNNGGIIINSNITESGTGGYTVTETSSGFSGKTVQLGGTNAFTNFTMADGNGTFSLVITANSTTLSGTLNLESGNKNSDIFVIGNSSTAATLSANIVTTTGTTGASIQIGQAGNFIVGAGGGSSAFANVISNNSSTGTGTFTKAGAGTVTLNGANTWTGNLNFSGGILNLNNSGAVTNVGTAAGTAAYFTGGTLQYSANNTFDLSSKILNSTSPISIDTNSQIVTYANALSSTNTAGLTKLGLGTLNLSSSALYTGNTTVTAGTLKINGLSSTGLLSVSGAGTLANYAGSIGIGGGLNIASGGTVNLQNGIAGDTLTLGSAGLNISGGSILKLDAGAGSIDSINSDGAYNFNGTGTTTINIQTLSGFSTGVYNLITNAPGISASSYALSGSVPGFGLSLSASGGILQLSVSSSAPSAAFWTGAQGLSWNTINSGNTNFNTDATSGINTVTLPAGPTTVTFSANGATNTANTVLGQNFSIQSLVINTASPVGIGGSNSLTISGDSNNNGITMKSVAGTTTISAASLILSGTQNWTNNSTSPLSVSSVVSGANPLTLAGTGPIVLSGANTLSGGINISSGTPVRISNAQALGLGSVTNNGSVDLNGQSTTALGVLSGAGTFTNSNASAATLVTTSGAFSGNIQNGTGIVSVNQTSGTLVLSGANAYTGTTTILGTLQLGNGSSNGTIGTGAVLDNGTLIFNNPSSQTFANIVNGSGGVTASGSGTVLLSGSNSYTGPTVVGAGATLQLGSSTALGSTGVGNLTVTASGTLDLNGNNLALTDNGINATGTITSTSGSPILTFNSATSVTTSSTLALTGSLSLTKLGTSTLTLGGVAGQYGYTGGTNISAGTLALTLATNSAGTMPGSGPISINAGGTLSVGAAGTTSTVELWQNSFVLNGGTLTNVDGYIQLASGGNIVVNGTNTFNREYSTNNPVNSKRLEFDGLMSGTGTLVFNDISALSQGAFYGIANDSNTFTGTAQVNSSSGAGVALILGSLTSGAGNQSLQYATVDLEGTGTTNLPSAFDFMSGVDSPVVGALKGTAPFSLIDTGGSPVTLSVGNNNTSTTYSGAMNGSGGLTKVGTGSFTLSGSNTYTGETTLAGGVLAPTATAIPAASIITFTGGTLQHSSGSVTDYSASIKNSTSPITIDTNGQSVIYATALDSSNTGGLTKLGLGTLSLTAAANYSGDSNINAGTLKIVGINSTGTVYVNSSNTGSGTLSGSGSISIAGTLNIGSGGAVDLRNSTIDTLTIGNGLTLNAGSIVGFDAGSSNDSFNVSGGSYNFNGSGTTTVDINAVAGFHGGTPSSPIAYDLITGISGVSAAQFSLGNALPGYNLSLGTIKLGSGSGPDTLVLDVVALAPAVEYWHGSRVAGAGTVLTATSGGSTNWDSGLSNNVDAGAIPGLATAVVFSATAAGNTSALTLGADLGVESIEVASSKPVGIGGANTLTLGQGITLDTTATGGTTITTTAVVLNSDQNWTNNSASLLQVSSNVSGAHALTIAGTGTTVLSGTNNFSGGLLVNTTADLQIGAAQALSVGTVGVNGILDLNGQTTVAIGALSGTGVVTNSNTSTGTLTSTGGTFAGVFQNGTGLTALNLTSGTLILTGSSTATGGTAIATGATLQLGDGVTTGGTIAGPVTNSGSLLFYGPGTQTLSGALSGAGSITINTPGMVIFSSSNTYNGSTAITTGTLQAGAANALGSGSNLTVSAVGVVDLNSFNASIGSLNGSSGATITNSSAAAGPATLTVTNGGTYAGAINDGVNGGKTALAVTTAGTLTLTTLTSNYSGGTTVNGPAALSVGNGTGASGQASVTDATLGSGPVVLGGTSNASIATLILNTQAGGAVSNHNFSNNISVTGNSLINNAEGNNTVLGGLGVSGSNNTIEVIYTNKNFNIAGPISGSGSLTLLGYGKDISGAFGGGGYIQIGNATTPVNNSGFTGTITANDTITTTDTIGAQIIAEQNGLLPNGTIGFTANLPGTGSAIVFATGVTAPQIGALASTTGGAITLATQAAEAANLTLGLNSSTGSTSYAGVLSGAGSVTKTDSNSQIFTGVNQYTGGTNVAGGTLTFAAPGALPNFSSLSIGAVAVAANHGTGPKNNLFASSLALTGVTGAWTGKLDLTNNDLDVQNGNLSQITNQVKQGYNNGTWNGTGGIVSSVAASDSTHLTALGVILNSVSGTTSGSTLYSSFDGATAAASTDVLIKYTYYGDTNLDGKVDGSDYSRIDNGALNGLTGWFNGDFNYDGVINGSDYTLIDNAYNTQGPQISAEIAGPTAQIAAGSAVPEPSTLCLVGIGAAGLLGRRRQRK